MKTPDLRTLMLSLIAVLLLAGTPAAWAASGTWTNALIPSGTNVLITSWSEPTNWLNQVVADGSGNTAYFNTLDVPSNTTIMVTLDTTNYTSVTNGNLYFGDTVTAQSVGNWTIADAGYPMTLDSTATSNSIIDVTLATGGTNNLVTGWGTATITASLTGTNTLVKTGPSPLILNPVSGNTFNGGLVISNGMVQLGAASSTGTANNSAPGSGPITFRGGALRLQNASIPGSNPTTSGSGITGLSVPVVVETGQTGTLYLPPRAFPAISSTVTGGGTLNLSVDYVRGEFSAEMSGFTGLVNIAASPRGTSDLRLGSGFPLANGGFANCRLHFTTNGLNGNGVNAYAQLATGTVIPVGEISSDYNTSFFTTGNAVVWRVGGLNTTADFGGATFNGIGFIKEGTGTWIWSGPTYAHTGVTVVSNGVLQVGNGGTTGAGLGATAVVSNYATIAFNRSDSALAITNVITGTGNLLQTGTGTTTLRPATGTNTYTGATVVAKGTLAIAGQAVLGAVPAAFTPDQLTLNGGTLRALTNLAINDVNRGITLGTAGGGMGADGTNTLTVANVISGAGSLSINNTGSVALAVANAYTGKTLLSSGTLVLADETPLGAAPGVATADQLTFSGGTLRSTATFAIDDANRGVTFGAAGGTLAPDGGTTLTIAEAIAGTGTLTKSGAGTLTLNGPSSRTGSTVISQGGLTLGPSGALTGPLISLGTGTAFDVSAVAGGFTLGSGQTLGGNGTVIGNVILGSGSTVSAGTSVGTLAINGTLTLNGGTNSVDISGSTNDLITVSGDLVIGGPSTIRLTLLSSLPVGTYSLIKYTGAFSGNAGDLSLAGYPISRLSASLVNNPATKSLDLVISGAVASIVWVGGANGNAWDTVITTNWLNGGSLDFFFNGDSVTFDTTGAANPNVNLVGSLSPALATVNASADYTFGGSGKLTGLAALSKAGAGNLTILTANDYAGATVINGGTVKVGNGTLGGSLGTGNVTNNSGLTYNLPGAQTVPNPISGTAAVTVEAGTVILTGNNSYGASVVNSGAVLQVGNGGASGSLGTGGVSGGGALIYKRTGTVTNNGSITGNGSLTVQGGGTVVLAADNNYAGPTLVDAATLRVGAGGTAGTLGSAASVTLTNGGILAFGRSDDLTNIVAITGTNGTLAQAGTGTLVLTNDNNAVGSILITAGKLQLGDGVNAAGTLGAGTVTVNTPGSLVFRRPDVFTVSNLVAGSGSLLQLGPTNLVITTPKGANTYSGGTTISNSTVLLVAAPTSPAVNGVQTVNQGGLGTGPISFLGNSVLQLEWANRADPDTGGAGVVANPLNVPAGQTATLWAPGRYTLSSVISGAGTFNLGVNYVRGDVTANWTNFTGVVNVISNAVSAETATNSALYDFRPANTNGFPKARLHLTPPVTMYSRATANVNIPIGELTGGPGSSLRSTTGGGGSPGVNENWLVGGLNTDFAFDGTLLDGNSFTKVGTGKWTLTGANLFTGTMAVSNGVLAFGVSPVDGVTVGSIAYASLISVASPGILNASGFADNNLHVGDVAAQTLGGNGTIQGGAYIGLSGTLAPGFSTNRFANLTVSSNLTVAGSALFKVAHVTGVVSDQVTAPVVTVNGGATYLTVTQVGTNDLQTGDTFKLCSVPITGAGFTSVNLPAVNADGTIAYVWTNKLAIDGTIQLLSGGAPTVNLTPTNLVVRVTGNTLDLSWSADHTGWRLQVQTNTLAAGISTNWATVTDANLTNRVVLPIDTTQGAVFYRLVSP